MQTYLFYDIETTGLSKSFDQVLHFAAIRTDLNLKELARHEIKVKLNPDSIPSPYALLTHKIGIKQMQEGVAEYEAIKQIHAWLNTPGTISLGYNTLGFDDEFLRFSFYRNLLKPYLHQYANQCYRMDIYPMAVMFYLFKKNVLTWPEKDNKISLKLELINAVNQFAAGQSHHAMVDVEVTLALARRFQAERETWEYLHGYFKKEIDKTRYKQVQHNIALCVSGKLGSQLNFLCPVLFLGDHLHYSNQSIWLRLDREDFSEITPKTIAEKTWAINKKPGESQFILPSKERFMRHMTCERTQLAQNNHQWLLKNVDLFENIKKHYINYTYPVFPETDVDASLYLNGFWSSEDGFFCEQFHQVSIKEKVKLLEKTHNPKLKLLALRIIGRHYPEALHATHTDEFGEYMRRVNALKQDEILIDFQGNKRLTPAVALQEIAMLRLEKQLDERDLDLLREYEGYLQARV